MTKRKIIFWLNDAPIEVAPDKGSQRLLDYLRLDLGLTGAKESCGKGECGACTVLVNDLAVNSCLVLVGQLVGARVLTIEGLAKGGELALIQEIFYRNTAIQCGYCTPGMILAAKALLLKTPDPTEAEIKRALAGNICRCSGYAQIVQSVAEAAILLKEVGKDEPIL